MGASSQTPISLIQFLRIRQAADSHGKIPPSDMPIKLYDISRAGEEIADSCVPDKARIIGASLPELQDSRMYFQ